MTPLEVRACRRAARIGGGDLYAALGLDQFVHRATIEEQLAAEGREIASILDHVPDFASQCNYRWAADPASYDVPTDAAFQRRALMMLAKYCVESTDRSGLAERLSGIILTQEFVTSYGLCSPRIKAVGQGRRVLSIPAGFVELAVWLFAGLRCWMAIETGRGKDHGEDGGWTMVTTQARQRPPRRFDHVTTFELMARTLAERGRDRALYGVNAALLIREQVPGLAGESGELDVEKLPHFDQNATYLVAEFALAHELGHLIAGHSLGDHGAPCDPAHEAEADHQACLLFAMSASTRLFGWGAQRHEPWVQAAIGLALFDCLLAGRTILNDGLLRRASLVQIGDSLVAVEKLRAACARSYLKTLLVRIAREGHAEDAQRVANLIDNNNAYLRDVRSALAALPDEQVKMAIAIAERSIDMRE